MSGGKGNIRPLFRIKINYEISENKCQNVWKLQ